MLIIQWILIPFAILLFVNELRLWAARAKRLHLLKAIVWASFAVGVWQPDLIQTLASYANIGRGADFLLYGLVVFTLVTTFHFLKLHEEQRKQITLLVRELALRDQASADSKIDTV